MWAGRRVAVGVGRVGLVERGFGREAGIGAGWLCERDGRHVARTG